MPDMSLPCSIFFHSAAVTPEGKMMVYGGIIKPDPEEAETTRTSDVYSSWITVPKLKHACWDALMHYVRNGKIEVPDRIKKLGLPPQYEQRLEQCVWTIFHSYIFFSPFEKALVLLFMLFFLSYIFLYVKYKSFVSPAKTFYLNGRRAVEEFAKLSFFWDQKLISLLKFQSNRF